jgi:membrane protease YdiL (CAAX protease family)
MHKHPIFFYFLIAFAFSWAYEVIAYGFFHPQGSLVRLLVQAPITFVGPTLSAFIMTAFTQGKTGMRRLLRRYVLWRVGFQWYLLTLFGPPTLFLLGYFIVPGGSAAFHAILAPAFLVRYLTNYIIYFIIGGPLGEEPGWRGFALPRLQWGYGPLVGSLILGVLWSLWHLPLMILVPGYNGSSTGFIGILIPFLEFLIEIVAMTVIITWVFNNVRGSLLLTMLLHGSLNTAGNTIPKLVPTLPQRSLVQPMEILLLVVSALLIIVLTRGYLSYQHYHQEAEALDLYPTGQRQG